MTIRPRSLAELSCAMKRKAKTEQLVSELFDASWLEAFEVETESLVRAHALPVERMELTERDREAW